MSLSEFDLIARYFIRESGRQDIVLGIGDDAAVLDVPQGMQLVTATDVMVEGVHFPTDTPAYDIGYKALAVNLSDMAAMGAEPAWMTLVLTLPHADEQWLTDFSCGLFDMAQQFGIALVGGDTSRGPLAVTIQIHGLVPAGRALTRNGAHAGDLVYVTGTLGDAALGLHVIQGKHSVTAADTSFLTQRLNRPSPRITEGMALREIATSAIDISDGLAADLGHILDNSRIGATIYLEDLPLSDSVRAYVETTHDWSLAISSGDDYELCFTIPAYRKNDLQTLAAGFKCNCTCIGAIEQQPGLRLQYRGQTISAGTGYDHFTSS